MIGQSEEWKMSEVAINIQQTLLQVDWPIFEDDAKKQSKLPYVRNNV
jgi:hypothetical protein